MKAKVYRPKQPIEVTLEFRDDEEIEDLLECLTRWTPTGGWPQPAEDFFTAMRGAIDESE